MAVRPLWIQGLVAVLAIAIDFSMARGFLLKLIN
jgi:hypothetical protein